MKNKWGRTTVHELAALRRKLNGKTRSYLNAKNKVRRRGRRMRRR